ncbi:MAG: glycosyltransferase family 9 protein [Erysipelotrichia bacterium]|nr:glycosyltransferase family 9 protein [Erysipelotrichia bacterium]
MSKISQERIPCRRNRQIATGIDIVLTAFFRLFHPFAKKSSFSLKPLRRESINTILIERFDGLGDLILSTPIFPALKQIFPEARVTLAVASWSAKLARLLPDVDEILVVDLPWVVGGGFHAWGNLLKNIRELRSRHFDLAIELRGDFRNILLQLMIKASWRAGFDITGCAFALSHVVPVAENHHSTDLVGEMLKNLAPEKSFDLKPRLLLPSEVLDAGMELLRKRGVSENTSDKRCIVIHPGARWAGRQWTAEGNAGIADRLIENGHQVVITGTPAEREFTDRILSLMRQSPVSLVGSTDFYTYLGVLAAADLFIGVDSGPMHLASAIGKPTIALFGPARPEAVGPRGSFDQILSHCDEFSCSPCSQIECTKGERSCMSAIELDEVWATIKNFLKYVDSGQNSNVASSVKNDGSL